MNDITKTNVHSASCADCEKELTCVCGKRREIHHCLSCGMPSKEQPASVEPLPLEQFCSLATDGFSLLSMQEQFGRTISLK
jgi:hypothetical protein